MIERYYLKADHQTEWDEVTREQFIAAEQAAGFRSKFGSDHPATGGFSGKGMRGRVEYVIEHEQPCPEQASVGINDADRLQRALTPQTAQRLADSDSDAEHDDNEQIYHFFRTCPDLKEATEHDGAPAATERGEQPKLIDQLLDAAIYAEDINRRVAARVQIVKMFDQHSTLIEQRERLLETAQFLLAMNATNYDRDAMRNEGGFEALQKAVDEAVRLDQMVSRTTTGREG